MADEFDDEEPAYSRPIEWLRAGQSLIRLESPLRHRLRFIHAKPVFAQPSQIQKLVVVASYSDGTDRDVTAQTVFLSNNEGTAEVTELGMVKATGPGAAFILARFDQFTEGSSLVVRPGGDFKFPDVPARNYIDELVDNRLRTNITSGCNRRRTVPTPCLYRSKRRTADSTRSRSTPVQSR